MLGRRFACFVLGIWLGCELLLGWVAMANAQSANRTLLAIHAPPAALALGLGPALRYQAAEQTRGLLEDWGSAQIALSGFLLLFLLLATDERQRSLALALFMLALSVGERLFLTPEMVAWGRALDYAPAAAQIGERTRLATIENIYLVMEALKWAAGLLLAGRLTLRTHGRSGRGRRQVDMVDEANHGYVDR
jgi:hypothetical protein